MDKKLEGLKKIADCWLKNNFIFAPSQVKGFLKIVEIKEFCQIDWSGAIPANSWKEFLLPHTERLFDIGKTGLKPSVGEQPPVMLLAMNILDLKALMLYDLVFANDVYYQNRRQKLTIVGYSADWPNDYKKHKVFSHKFQKDVLEHVQFDVFIAGGKKSKADFYSGSEKGRKLLDQAGVKDYQNIQFAGAVAEAGPDKRMVDLEGKIGKSEKYSLWQTLNEICLACGKCSTVCPTCFCFDLVDRINPADSRRDRVRGNCFHNDFSKVSGGGKELDTVKKKIFFWYTHKFVRIPHEHKVPGCVSCGRCVKVCPVGIDIFKNIAKLSKIHPVK
jgi:ferredoxin